jgi:hypothetical protein
VISAYGKTCLIEDYSKALSLVNDAAHTLEDAAITIGGAGFVLTRKSSMLIDHVNEVYAEIMKLRSEINEVTPDD